MLSIIIKRVNIDMIIINAIQNCSLWISINTFLCWMNYNRNKVDFSTKYMEIYSQLRYFECTLYIYDKLMNIKNYYKKLGPLSSYIRSDESQWMSRQSWSSYPMVLRISAAEGGYVGAWSVAKNSSLSTSSSSPSDRLDSLTSTRFWWVDSFTPYWRIVSFYCKICMI